MVRLTTDEVERKIWLSLLNANGADLPPDSRVCTHHFHSIDISTDGNVSLTFKTKYKSNTGNDSINAPPRPAALKVDVEVYDLNNGASVDQKRKRKSLNPVIQPGIITVSYTHLTLPTIYSV